VKLEEVELVENHYFEPSIAKEFVSSGCTLLDNVLGRGYPIGRIVNIIGDRSSAKIPKPETKEATMAQPNPILELVFVSPNRKHPVAMIKNRLAAKTCNAGPLRIQSITTPPNATISAHFALPLMSFHWRLNQSHFRFGGTDLKYYKKSRSGIAFSWKLELSN